MATSRSQSTPSRPHRSRTIGAGEAAHRPVPVDALECVQPAALWNDGVAERRVDRVLDDPHQPRRQRRLREDTPQLARCVFERRATIEDVRRDLVDGAEMVLVDVADPNTVGFTAGSRQRGLGDVVGRPPDEREDDLRRGASGERACRRDREGTRQG